jgi:hypothetical protein
LQDRRALAGIDWPAVFDDLTDAGSPRWCDLAVLTHVVLASDRSTGRYAGLLGLIERSTTLEPYLMIEAAMVRPSDAGVTLRRAMLAHALARIVCLDGKPAALAAPRGDWSIEPTLRDLGLQIRTAVLHPPVGGNVVDFNTASLARRIGTDVLLDLRLVSEASLLRDLRGLHGVRSDRSTVSAASTAAAGRPTPKLARRDTATRRPGEATHTGRTG